MGGAESARHLGYTVKRGILSRQESGPAGRAGRGRDVVLAQHHTVLAQAHEAGQQAGQLVVGRQAGLEGKDFFEVGHLALIGREPFGR